MGEKTRNVSSYEQRCLNCGPAAAVCWKEPVLLVREEEEWRSSLCFCFTQRRFSASGERQTEMMMIITNNNVVAEVVVDLMIKITVADSSCLWTKPLHIENSKTSQEHTLRLLCWWTWKIFDGRHSTVFGQHMEMHSTSQHRQGVRRQMLFQFRGRAAL